MDKLEKQEKADSSETAEKPDMTFAYALREARLEKKMTQEELGESVGITGKHIQQLESGRRKPSIKVQNRIVQVLDFSLDSMFSDSDDNKQKLKNKINLCLDRCDVHELQVTYATLEAMLKKD